ncbi:hypothetical protein [Chryseobacterium echinoideorum]|uniref:hypothetical protein n=1 Tax=Chryseobacterium echinoideorum TaxID=1549648 RepID=UPI0011872720|nr:hypothetical protein [Chryseobacterium echinoideorum]
MSFFSASGQIYVFGNAKIIAAKATVVTTNLEKSGSFSSVIVSTSEEKEIYDSNTSKSKGRLYNKKVKILTSTKPDHKPKKTRQDNLNASQNFCKNTNDNYYFRQCDSSTKSTVLQNNHSKPEIIAKSFESFCAVVLSKRNKFLYKFIPILSINGECFFTRPPPILS